MPLRYAHSEGHTDVCYSDCGGHIFTCGSEGDVRIWSGVDDGDQKDICVGEKAWAIFHKRSNIFVATDTNIIQAYSFPELEVDGIITRFKAPAVQIDVSYDGSTLAAGSCDMDIHVVNVESMEHKCLSGHKAPLLGVALDPHLEYVASSSCDGSVRVWNLETRNVIKQWDYLEKSNSFENAKTLCRLNFQPSGRHLAVPVGKKVMIYERETWSQTQSLSIENNEHVFGVVQFSKCNKYIAAGTSNGNVYIWNFIEAEVITKYISENGHGITAISWHPRTTNIVYCNNSGQLGDLECPIKYGHVSHKIGKPDNIINPGDIPLGEPVFDDDDDDDENVISLEKIKAESGFGEKNSDTKSEKDETETESIVDQVRSEPQIPVTDLQEPFQPSSTPSHLQQRFMVWNNFGIVRLFVTEDLDEIDVEFHDTSIHHGFRLNNSSGYTMATLTNQVLTLVAPRRSNNPGRLVCMMLKAWDSQKEWEISLGLEEPIAVAAGDGWIALATDTGTIRIFSIDGTQTDIMTSPGLLISMAGSGYSLCLFFYSAQGVNNDHFISYLLVNISPSTKLVSQVVLEPLSLSPKSKLQWVGSSDEGSFTTYDSEGVLRLLYNRIWRPICSMEDRPKGKYDHYFVIGVSERSHTIRCILCKGAHYPPVIPKPLVSEVEWQIPLYELNTEKSKLEEEMLRCMITLPSLDKLRDPEECSEAKKSVEKSISITVMKLFALACKSGLEGRAVSLCESMPTVEVVKLASKYAAKLGRHQLSNRVSEIAARMSQAVKEPELRYEEPVFRERNYENGNGSDYVSKPKACNDGSQDMFSDSENLPKKKDSENIILMMKKRKAEVNVSTVNTIKKISNNPFKKVSKNDFSDNSSEKEPRVNYMDWFKENIAKLKEEYPLLKDTELAIMGMKKYKKDVDKVDKLNTSCENDISPSTEVPPDVQPSNENHFTDKQSICESGDVVAATPEDSIDKRKRKLTANESGVKKKAASSAAAKLKAFSFAKKS